MRTVGRDATYAAIAVMSSVVSLAIAIFISCPFLLHMASRATFLRVGIASDRLLRLTSGSRSRPFSALSSFASTPGDSVAFPRVARGLDIDLNWSLAAECVRAPASVGPPRAQPPI